jgi:putative addiction module killer protein
MPVEMIPREILICHDESGRVPFLDWLNGLDVGTRARVRVRIDRIEESNFGDVEPVGGGVSELRLDFGPGYRVYFGQKGQEVHLIRGGSKKSQDADIREARRFWSEHG